MAAGRASKYHQKLYPSQFRLARKASLMTIVGHEDKQPQYPNGLLMDLPGRPLRITQWNHLIYVYAKEAVTRDRF